jgi:hypothetical protein
MKRLLPFALLALSLLGAALFTMSHSSWGHSSAYASSSSQLGPFYEHNHPHFIGNPNHKQGDDIEFSSPVYDSANKEVIGSSNGECFYASDTVYHCDWTLMLPDGNIILSGAQKAEASHTVYAIVGGTGAYYQIRGEATLTATGINSEGEAAQYKYTFHLAGE